MSQNWLRWPRLWVTIFIATALILLFALAVLVTQYTEHRNALEQQAFASAQRQAADAAQSISMAFSDVMTVATELASDLTSGNLAYENITERLQAEVDARPDIDGIAITFEPFVYDADERLYQEYIYKLEDGSFDMLIGASYDYSQPPTDAPDSPQTGWYHNPLNNGPMWNEPFFATGAQKVLIEYGVPFYESEAEGAPPVGVVTIDYSVTDTRALVSQLELGATGYGFVISSSGTFLAHPVPDLVAQQSIQDYALQTQDEAQAQALIEAADRALTGEQVSLEMVDTISGEASWLFFEPIPQTDWALGILLNRSEFAPDTRQTLREQVAILLVIAALVLIAVSLLVRVHQGRAEALWRVSLTFSVLGIGLIVGIWYLSDSLSDGAGLVEITGEAALDSYLTRFEQQHLQADGEVPQRIPTGVFVQAVQFPDPMSVTVNGYIWQRYPLGSDIAQGFMLPQRIGEEATVEEVYREQTENDELIIWYVGVTLRQLYDPGRYPFDSRQITIRLSPLALGERIILTPDLESYSLISPQLLPGLDAEVDVNNWQMESSTFSYDEVTYNSSLGLTQRSDYTTVPELRFTIKSQRYVLGPFIAYLLPGVVAAMMLFAFLINERAPGEKQEMSEALNYAAALFFVIAVAHTALRDGIAAVGLSYLEHLYILLYITIIAIGLNTYYVVKRPDAWLVRYRNNLIVKLLYWPLLVGTLLLSTLVVFVYS